jgi:hypothetical protein
LADADEDGLEQQRVVDVFAHARSVEDGDPAACGEILGAQFGGHVGFDRPHLDFDEGADMGGHVERLEWVV